MGRARLARSGRRAQGGVRVATIPFELVVGPLSAALGLSVGVERILEFFKNFVEPRMGTELARHVPDTAEVKVKTDTLEETLELGTGGNAKEWDEQVPHEIALVQPATDPDDGATLRAFILQLLGFAVGILLARLFNVQLFSALGAHLPGGAPLDFVLTGLLIGGGSAPVHLLIRFVTERK